MESARRAGAEHERLGLDVGDDGRDDLGGTTGRQTLDLLGRVAVIDDEQSPVVGDMNLGDLIELIFHCLLRPSDLGRLAQFGDHFAGEDALTVQAVVLRFLQRAFSPNVGRGRGCSSEG